MRFAIHALTRGLVALIAILLAVPGIAVAAQATTSQPVGSSTIAFTSDWAYADAASSDLAYLVYQAPGQVPGPESDYFYLELDNSTLAMLDNQYVTEAVMMPNLRDAFQYGITPLIAQGDLSAPTLWTLYSFDSSSGPALLLMVASTSLIPNMTAVAWITASPQNFGQLLPAAQQEITINGQPNVMAQVDANAILAAASGPQQTTAQTQQPAQQQQPPAAQAPVTGQTQQPAQPPAAQAPATGQTQQPAAQAPATGQASVPPSSSSQAGILAVGNDAVTYGVDWQYLPDDSTDVGAAFQARTNAQVIFIYYFSADGGTVDAATALQQFDQEFYTDYDPSTVQMLTTETLPSGVAWSMHRVDDANGSLAYLTTVSVSPQGTRYQVLISPIDLFPTSLPGAQQGFTINDTAAFTGLDPAYVSSFLDGAPLAQQPQTGVASTAGGQTTDYASMDAPTGCDGIGWVITDPSQMPATQPDVDHASSCVGGASYLATCGTYAVTGGEATVECVVSVTAGSAPVTASASQFTLVDASGATYPVDMATTTSILASLGLSGLPEGSVSPGTAVSGPVFFTVPGTVAQGWTIRIAPDTIATTGEQPGVLVVDVQLQNFDVFLQ